MMLLVTGASGFIGARLCQAWCGRGAQVVGTYLSAPTSVPTGVEQVELDVRDTVAVANVMRRCRPDVVIHSAGLASLQACEEHPHDADACNREGSANVAAAAREVGARTIYISTDLVFDGGRGWYRDTEVPRPICCYGIAKHEGEKAILAQCPNACILRLSWVYGTSINGRMSATEILVHALRRGSRVELFTDEYRTPLLVDDVVAVVEVVIYCVGKLAIGILDVFEKKTKTTPQNTLTNCRRRFAAFKKEDTP